MKQTDPNGKPRILLLENIHPVSKSCLEESGFDVDLETSAFSEEALIDKIKNYHLVGIRSKTVISPKFIESSPHLLAVGCFCIGTNQVALKKANEFGIPVFNAPYSNTRSVAEMVIAQLISLARGLSERNINAHNGVWTKSASGSHEVRGKTLGIVGYGHIGSQVSVLAEALGMNVIFYDVVKKLPLGNSTAIDTLGDLLKASDFVTLHVPETPETKNMMSDKELQYMKKGSYLLNLSRGTVVVIEDLVKALDSGQLAGAALDVFPTEPKNNKEKFENPLRGKYNVILSPHVGGSTEEAQESIGLEVARSFMNFVENGSTTGAVNFPNVDLPAQGGGAHRLINVHKNVPGVLGVINNIVSGIGANIKAQYLSTDQNIGYLVMDMEQAEASEAHSKIKDLETSIRTRLIY